MDIHYEYKFVRLGEKKSWLGLSLLVQQSAQDSYQDVIRDHAREGWRLVQIFAPGIGVQGVATYYELIFERPIPVRERPSAVEEPNSDERITTQLSTDSIQRDLS